MESASVFEHLITDLMRNVFSSILKVNTIQVPEWKVGDLGSTHVAASHAFCREK